MADLSVVPPIQPRIGGGAPGAQVNPKDTFQHTRAVADSHLSLIDVIGGALTVLEDTMKKNTDLDLASDSIEIKDRRRRGFYQVDNAVTDAVTNGKLSLEAHFIYSFLVRHANRETMQAYAGINYLNRRIKMSKSTIILAFRELCDKYLIEHIRTKPNGQKVYAILDIDEFLDFLGGSPENRGGFQENRGGSPENRSICGSPENHKSRGSRGEGSRRTNKARQGKENPSIPGPTGERISELREMYASGNRKPSQAVCSEVAEIRDRAIRNKIDAAIDEANAINEAFFQSQPEYEWFVKIGDRLRVSGLPIRKTIVKYDGPAKAAVSSVLEARIEDPLKYVDWFVEKKVGKAGFTWRFFGAETFLCEYMASHQNGKKEKESEKEARAMSMRERARQDREKRQKKRA